MGGESSKPAGGQVSKPVHDRPDEIVTLNPRHSPSAARSPSGGNGAAGFPGSPTAGPGTDGGLPDPLRAEVDALLPRLRGGPALDRSSMAQACAQLQRHMAELNDDCHARQERVSRRMHAAHRAAGEAFTAFATTRESLDRLTAELQALPALMQQLERLSGDVSRTIIQVEAVRKLTPSSDLIASGVAREQRRAREREAHLRVRVSDPALPRFMQTPQGASGGLLASPSSAGGAFGSPVITPIGAASTLPHAHAHPHAATSSPAPASSAAGAAAASGMGALSPAGRAAPGLLAFPAMPGAVGDVALLGSPNAAGASRGLGGLLPGAAAGAAPPPAPPPPPVFGPLPEGLFAASPATAAAAAAADQAALVLAAGAVGGAGRSLEDLVQPLPPVLSSCVDALAAYRPVVDALRTASDEASKPEVLALPTASLASANPIAPHPHAGLPPLAPGTPIRRSGSVSAAVSLFTGAGGAGADLPTTPARGPRTHSTAHDRFSSPYTASPYTASPQQQQQQQQQGLFGTPGGTSATPTGLGRLPRVPSRPGPGTPGQAELPPHWRVMR